MKRLFKFKYQKLLLLVIFLILSYFIFSENSVQIWINQLNSFGYIAIFIAGFLFSFGFTTPFATGLLLVLNPSNIILASIIGGIGSTLSDFMLFKIVKYSFMDEFKKIEKTKLIKEIHYLLSKDLSAKLNMYLLYIFIGIIIASPLPDELGVTMTAGLTKIKSHMFIALSFILKTAGILAILLIGQAI